MKNLIIVGIDPGNAGALCLLQYNFVTQKVTVLELQPMPIYKYSPKKGKSQTRIDEFKLRTLFKEWSRTYGLDCIVLEKQQKNKQSGGNLVSGSASSGTTMEQYGLLRGICTGMEIEYIEVPPATWTSKYPKDIQIPPEIEALKLEPQKKRSLALSMQEFPEVSLYRSSRCTKPSDAYSDCLLIGNYFFLRKEFSSLINQAA